MNRPITVQPIILGPKNAEPATGWPWRWVRDTARALGVPLIGHGKKLGVRADLFVAALERAGELVTAPNSTAVETDHAELIRRALGKKLKSAPDREPAPMTDRRFETELEAMRRRFGKRRRPGT